MTSLRLRLPATKTTRCAALLFFLLGGCGGNASTSDDGRAPGSLDAADEAHDASTSTLETGATNEASTDAHRPEAAAAVDASGPSRNATCTPLKEQTGTAIDSAHGRLDGYLVYIVNVGEDPECNGDDSHVHLQIDVSGSVYDVAVDIGTAPNDEVGLYETALAIPGGAWSEGWHATDALSYPTLGIHSTTFPTMAPTAVAPDVVALLANTAAVSIFCKGYKQGNGCHDVHYENGAGDDGAIVLDPTGTSPHVLFFRFATPAF